MLSSVCLPGLEATAKAADNFRIFQLWPAVRGRGIPCAGSGRRPRWWTERSRDARGGRGFPCTRTWACLRTRERDWSICVAPSCAPPLALERLTESSHGQLVFELTHPRADGATHLLLEPLELIEKLSVLIPPPRFHTLRFHGGLGPRAAWRSAVIPRRHDAVDEGPTAAGPREGLGPLAEPAPGALGAQRESSMWAALLRRVFALDVFQCPRCGGRRRIVGCTRGDERLRVVLERLGLVSPSPSAEPARSPPRASE